MKQGEGTKKTAEKNIIWESFFKTKALLLRSRSTSGRTAFQPDGNENYNFVKDGNILAACCMLLGWLASCMGVRWLLEQPNGRRHGGLTSYSERSRSPV